MATSLKAQGFKEIFLIGDSGGNQRGMAAVAEELTKAWSGQDIVIAHIPEYYNYSDVLQYQKEVLGIDEDPRLEGLHDDYYITSMIMNDNPQHVRLEQRIAANKASINNINLLPIPCPENPQASTQFGSAGLIPMTGLLSGLTA